MRKRLSALLLVGTLLISSISVQAGEVISTEEATVQENTESVENEVEKEEADELEEVDEVVEESGMDERTEALVEEYYGLLGSLVTTYASEDVYAAELAKFPSDYQELLKELHKKHPNWVFKAVNTGLEWNDVVAGESYGTRSLTSKSYADILLSKASGDYDATTGKYIPKDGSTWVNVSDPGVAYFVDPRNYLNEEYIFAMEYLGYDATCHTLSGVESILAKTDIANNQIKYTNTSGKTISTSLTYGESILAAGINNGISPLSLAARIKQETGGGLSYGGLSGKYSYGGKSYMGYYNYYNIGSTADTSKPPLVNGLEYAIKAGWTSPMLAMDGGAKFLASSYISKGQNTVYFQKFNTVYKPYYSHQYMQNITAPLSEGNNTYLTYKKLGNLESSFVFYIPVYKNMPSRTGEIQISKNVSTAKSTWDLSLRNGPATSYSKVTTIPAGATITVSGGVFTDDEIAYGQKLQNPYWMKATYKNSSGKVYSGYVSSNYIEMDTSVTLKSGATKTLELKKCPSGENVYYETTDPAVATVSTKGVVKAVGTGKCMIYAVTSSGQTLDAIGIAVENAKVVPNTPVLGSIKNSKDGISITWEKVANANGYVVYRKKSGESSWKQVSTIQSGTTTSFTDASVVSGVSYSYTVQAYIGQSYGEYNKNGIGLLRLSEPVVSVSSTSTTSAKITWSKVTGAKGYYVYRRSGTSGSWTHVATIDNVDTLTYTNTGLSAATKYYYTVKAFNGSTYSTYPSSGVLATTKAITYTTYQTTCKLNYRTGAGTSYSKGGSLAKGTKVQVEDGYSKNANGYTWYRVKIGSKNYYIASKYLTKVSTSNTGSNTSQPTTGKTYTTYQTTTTLNYRTGAGTSYSKGGSLAKGAKVQVEDGYSKNANGYTWYRVKIGSKNYYIASKYLTKVSSGNNSTTTKKTYTTYKTTTKLNYRTGAGTSYSKGGSLATGAKVQVENGYSAKANGYTWYRVKIGSKNYYIASKYLKKA